VGVVLGKADLAKLLAIDGGDRGAVSSKTEPCFAWPTAAELGLEVDAGVRQAIHQRLASEREEMEQKCRTSLAGAPGLRARFETGVCQRYAAIREEQAREFTLAWPLLRRSALRLGHSLKEEGRIEEAFDVFHLSPRLEPLSGAELAHWRGERCGNLPMRVVRRAGEFVLEVVASANKLPKT